MPDNEVTVALQKGAEEAMALEEQTTELAVTNERLDDLATQIFDLVAVLRDGGGSIDADGNVVGANGTTIVPSDREASTDLIRKITGLGGDENAIDETMTTMAKFDDGLESLASIIGGGRTSSNPLSQILDGFGNKLSGLDASFGGAIGMLGKFAGALGIAAGSIELMSTGIDTYQQARYASISQTGSDADLTLGAREMLQVQGASMFTGLREEEARAIQENLIANRIQFDSEQYAEGFQFSQAARLNYALDINQATDLYVKSVARGTLTTEQLSEKLEELADISAATGVTMSELTSQYSESLDAWSKRLGEGFGAEVANSVAGMFTNPEQQAFAEQLMGSVDFTPGSYGNALVSRYVNQGNDYADAMMLAGVDMLGKGMIGGQSGRYFGYLSLGAGGKSMYEYIQDMDFDGLERALEDVKEHPTELVNWATVVQMMRGVGADVKADATPRDVVAWWEEFYGVAEGTRSASLGADYTRQLQDIEADYSMDWQSIGPNGENMKLEGAEARIGRAAGEGFTSDESKDLQDEVAAILLANGVVSTSSFEGIGKDDIGTVYSEILDAYMEQGGAASGSFADFARKSGGDIRSIVERYGGSAEGETVNPKGQQTEMHADITLAIEGDLGDYLVMKHQEAILRQARDEGQ